MPRLVLLNGPPGIGKSTLARRYAEEHPGVLACDIDLLRTLVGGWRADFEGAGELIRPAALALVEAYLRSGHDVVLPQLLARESEVERFGAAAGEAGAAYVEVLLTDVTDDPAAAVERFHRRGPGSDDPWHEQVRDLVAARGGDALLADLALRLADLATRRPWTTVLPTAEGDVDGAYAALVAALA